MNAGRAVVEVVGWVLVGAVSGTAVVGMLTIGKYLMPVAVLLAVGLLALNRWQFSSRSWWLISGLAAGPGLVAWLNRQGPGEYCTSTPQMTQCTDMFDPRPLWAVAAIFALAGVTVALVVRRTGRRVSR